MSKPKINLAFVRRNNRGLDCLAVLSLVPSIDEIRTPAQALAAFKLGVTAWVEETPEGRELWDYSSQDLNIGDLGERLQDAGLKHFLAAAGFESVEVVYWLNEGDEVSYDHVLAEPAEG